MAGHLGDRPQLTLPTASVFDPGLDSPNRGCSEAQGVSMCKARFPNSPLTGWRPLTVTGSAKYGESLDCFIGLLAGTAKYLSMVADATRKPK